MSLGILYTVNLISQFDFLFMGSSERQPKSMALMWESDKLHLPIAIWDMNSNSGLWMHPVLLVHTQIPSLLTEICHV